MFSSLLFFWFGCHPWQWDLFMALHLRITPGNVHGTIWYRGNGVQGNQVQGKWVICCTVPPTLGCSTLVTVSSSSSTGSGQMPDISKQPLKIPPFWGNWGRDVTQNLALKMCFFRHNTRTRLQTCSHHCALPMVSWCVFCREATLDNTKEIMWCPDHGIKPKAPVSRTCTPDLWALQASTTWGLYLQ